MSVHHGFIEHYLSAILYANVSQEFQVLLGLVLIGLNVLIYSFVLIRRRRRIRDARSATNAA